MRHDYAAQDWHRRERQIDRDTQLVTEGIAWGVSITLLLVSVFTLIFVELSR